MNLKVNIKSAAAQGNSIKPIIIRMPSLTAHPNKAKRRR